MIEALALSFVTMGFISFFLGTFYFSVVHVGMNYLLHEHLICNATQGTKNCRPEFHQKSKYFLFLGDIKKIETTKKKNLYRGLVEIKMPFNQEMKISKELDLYR